MRTLFTILFSLSAFALALCLNNTRKVHKKYILALRNTLISAIVCVFCHIAIINTHNYFVASVIYSIFYISIDFLILSIFDFSRKYTKYRIRLPWFNWVLIIGGILDVTNSFLNIFFGHSFSLISNQIPAMYGEKASVIFKVIMKWPFFIHLFACYFVIVLLLIVLIIRIVTTPKLYRFQHTNILIAISVCLIGDGFYVFTTVPIDFSIIFFAISAILVTIYAIHFTPSKLIQKQLQAVVSGMNDSVVVFDIDAELIYKNPSMENFEKKYNSIGLNTQGPFNSILTGSSYSKLKTMPDREFDEEVQKNGNTYTFHISIRSLRDEKNTFLGAFFIIHDKTEEMEKINRERYLAIHDKLTEIYNREGFYEKVRGVMANEPDKKYLMVCSDIDNFKLINDLFGREAGDEFLVRIASAIKQYTKESEIYARLESDKFALLMEKVNFSEEKFIKYPELISYITKDLHYPVNIHIGVYEIEDINMPVSVMCDRAFMAIKTIKGNLQKKIAFYNTDLRKSIVREQQLIGDFSLALASEQFQIYLQPQVKTDGNVYGAEALVRWHHPKEGIMNPDAFIPLFENKSLITALDQYVWNCAAQRLQNWKERGINNMYISVNISPKDFVYLDIYKTFVDLVQKYDIDPQNLRLEITESAILMNLKAQLVLINKLRDYGFVIEMDDFGSGYSSLNMLKDIPFDVLKIDMAFLQSTENQERSIQILHSIIKLSKRLNMPVITEGVETKEQVEILKGMGTDYYQGFYFARPMPIADFELNYINKR